MTRASHRSACSVALFVVALVFFAGCGRGGDGLVKYPVRGKVLLNGAPQAGIVVRFQLRNVEADKAGNNARFPSGVTNDQGEFELSTNGERDGAVAGEYTVAFVWPESNDPPPGDRFGGAFSGTNAGKHRVRIEPRENVLEAFQLTPPPLRNRGKPRD